MIVKNTEGKIKCAARNVFTRKGLDGSRMQEIADEAGINKSLLHYYFRSKQKLFDAIFEEAFLRLIPIMASIFEGEGSLFERIDVLAHNYCAVIDENTFVPEFLLHEINRNPGRLASLMKEGGIDVKRMQMLLDKEIKLGNISPITITSLMVNLMSMLVMPYIGRPLIERIWFDEETSGCSYDEYLARRPKEVAAFIKRALKA